MGIENVRPALERIRPLLFGEAETVEGYYALEEAERGETLNTLRLHRSEVALWYRLLTIYLRAMTGTFSHPEAEADDLQRRAWGLQLQLLGLGVGTAKSALDRLLAGYYSLALADVRHMTESCLHIAYLKFKPETAPRWYSSTNQQKNPVAARDALDLVVKQANEVGLPGLGDRMEAAFKTLQLANKGAHPTPEGIRQTDADAEKGRFVFGPTYDEHLALIGFDHGHLRWCSWSRWQ